MSDQLKLCREENVPGVHEQHTRTVRPDTVGGKHDPTDRHVGSALAAERSASLHPFPEACLEAQAHLVQGFEVHGTQCYFLIRSSVAFVLIDDDENEPSSDSSAGGPRSF